MRRTRNRNSRIMMNNNKRKEKRVEMNEVTNINYTNT